MNHIFQGGGEAKKHKIYAEGAKGLCLGSLGGTKKPSPSPAFPLLFMNARKLNWKYIKELQQPFIVARPSMINYFGFSREHFLDQGGSPPSDWLRLFFDKALRLGQAMETYRCG